MHTVQLNERMKLIFFIKTRNRHFKLDGLDFIQGLYAPRARQLSTLHDRPTGSRHYKNMFKYIHPQSCTCILISLCEVDRVFVLFPGR